MAQLKAVAQAKPDPRTGQAKGAKSPVAFPYFNLASSIEAARAIHERAGGRCDRATLAAYLDYKSKANGSFVARVTAAKMFGLVDQEGSQLRVTPRARAIIAPVTPAQAQGAKVDAFLDVELFRRVYDELGGSAMPEEAGLRNLIETQYGVTKARVAPTVRILKESAEEAGVFKAAGPTRMIRPPMGAAPPASAPSTGAPPADTQRDDPPLRHGNGGGRGGSGGGNGDGIHPAFSGLLGSLPEPGSPLSAKRRKALTDAFANIVDVVYPEDDA